MSKRLTTATVLFGYHTADGLHVASIPTAWFYEVPEPGMASLLLTGLIVLESYAWRKRG